MKANFEKAKIRLDNPSSSITGLEENRRKTSAERNNIDLVGSLESRNQKRRVLQGDVKRRKVGAVESKDTK